jgi:phosphonate transport system substrate-binding protein
MSRREYFAIIPMLAAETTKKLWRAFFVLAFFVMSIQLWPCLANAAEPPIRFGLTAAVARENLDLYDRWAAYLGRKVGRPVEFEQRRSYREDIELLETGEHDFSWICSYPFSELRQSKLVGLLVVPIFHGEPLYRAYIIVHKDSSFRQIGELRGRVFAYSDPDSNSGYIVPRQMLRDIGENPDSFFRKTFFTYSHTETIEAVSERVADAASVDSYVWEYLNHHDPELTAQTRIIQKSRSFGFPPLVYKIGIDPDLLRRMRDALLTMDQDPEGRALLSELMLDRFSTAPASLYDSVNGGAGVR